MPVPTTTKARVRALLVRPCGGATLRTLSAVFCTAWLAIASSSATTTTSYHVVELFGDVLLRTVPDVVEVIARAYKPLPPRANSTAAAQLRPKLIIHGLIRIEGNDLTDGDVNGFLEMVWQIHGPLVITDTNQIRNLNALSQLVKVRAAAFYWSPIEYSDYTILCSNDLPCACGLQRPPACGWPLCSLTEVALLTVCCHPDACLRNTGSDYPTKAQRQVVLRMRPCWPRCLNPPEDGQCVWRRGCGGASCAVDKTRWETYCYIRRLQRAA